MDTNGYTWLRLGRLQIDILYRIVSAYNSWYLFFSFLSSCFFVRWAWTASLQRRGECELAWCTIRGSLAVIKWAMAQNDGSLSTWPQETPFWFESYLQVPFCDFFATMFQQKSIKKRTMKVWKWSIKIPIFANSKLEGQLQFEEGKPHFFEGGREYIWYLIRLKGRTCTLWRRPTRNEKRRYRRTLLWSTWVTSWDDGPMTVGARRFTEWWILQKKRRQCGEGAWPLPSSITSTRHPFGRKDSARAGHIWERWSVIIFSLGNFGSRDQEKTEWFRLLQNFFKLVTGKPCNDQRKLYSASWFAGCNGGSHPFLHQCRPASLVWSNCSLTLSSKETCLVCTAAMQRPEPCHRFKLLQGPRLRLQESFWCSSTWRAMARLIPTLTSSVRKLPDTWPKIRKGSSRMAVVILVRWVSSWFVARGLHWHVVRVAFFIEQSRSMQPRWTPMWTIISSVNARVCVCVCVCVEHLVRKLDWIEATQPAPCTGAFHILRLRWGWPLADTQAPDSS